MKILWIYSFFHTFGCNLGQLLCTKEMHIILQDKGHKTQSLPALQQTSIPTQLGVIPKLTEGALGLSSRSIKTLNWTGPKNESWCCQQCYHSPLKWYQALELVQLTEIINVMLHCSLFFLIFHFLFFFLI